MKSIFTRVLSISLACVFLISPLHASGEKNPDILSGKVPAQVLGVILLHGAGIGSSLLLTDRDYSKVFADHNQDQVFNTAESMCQIQSGGEGIYSVSTAYGMGRMFRPWLAGIARASLMEFQSRTQKASGASLEGGLGLIFLNRDGFKIYYDCGFGLCLTDRAFPKNGTKTNFISSFGVGSVLRIAPGVNWKIGFRHIHISNGGLIAGDERNPGYDSNGIFTGLVFFR